NLRSRAPVSRLNERGRPTLPRVLPLNRFEKAGVDEVFEDAARDLRVLGVLTDVQPEPAPYFVAKPGFRVPVVPVLSVLHHQPEPKLLVLGGVGDVGDRRRRNPGHHDADFVFGLAFFRASVVQANAYKLVPTNQPRLDVVDLVVTEPEELGPLLLFEPVY